MSRRLTEPALRRFRTDVVSDLLDFSLVGRAWTRMIAALLWITLAVVDGRQNLWLWGVPLFLGACAAGLDDRAHLGTRSGLYRPTVARLLDGARIVEATGLVLAGAATGTIIGGFEHPDAATIASVALLASTTVLFANTATDSGLRRLAGHIATRRWAILMCSLGTVAAIGLLWPEDPTTANCLGLVTGSLFALASGIRSASLPERAAYEIDLAAGMSYHLALQDFSLGLHNDLKGPAQATLSALSDEDEAVRVLVETFPDVPEEHLPTIEQWLRADTFSRQVTRELATRVSEYVEFTRSGNPRRPRTAVDIVHATLRLRDRRTQNQHRRAVVRQLDPATLSELDNTLISVCLVEFVNNALIAGTKHLKVSVDAVSIEGTRHVAVAVECACGRRLGDVQPGTGTLGMIVDRLKLWNGTLTVSETRLGTHVTTATWPTDAEPSELSVTPSGSRTRLHKTG